MYARKTIPVAVLCLLALSLYAGPVEEVSPLPWHPAKPVTIIVPWEKGSAVDTAVRAAALTLEEPLNQRLYIFNQPGEDGVVGMRNALEARHDGYTLAAGRASSFSEQKILGRLDTTWEEWAFFLIVAEVPVISVQADSPHKTFDDLLSAFAERPGELAVGFSGDPSEKNNPVTTFFENLGVEYIAVGFENKEAIATVQTAAGAAISLRNGSTRALAALSDEPLAVEGFGEIPPATNWSDDYTPQLEYFGIFIPADVSPNVLETFYFLWQEHIVESEELAVYAANGGFAFTPYDGETAKEKALPYLQRIAWNHHAAGRAVISPDEIGIPEP